jgi:hypothetical protein
MAMARAAMTVKPDVHSASKSLEGLDSQDWHDCAAERCSSIVTSSRPLTTVAAPLDAQIVSCQL